MFLARVHAGKPIEIWGDGEGLRDFFFIDDLSRALVAGVDQPAAAGGVFNLGGRKTVTLNGLVAAIERALGVKMEVSFQEARKFDVPAVELDWSSARRVLGWSPEVELDDGIRRTAEWMRNWFEE